MLIRPTTFLLLLLLTSACRKDPDPVLGCTDPASLSFNAAADTPDNSCRYIPDELAGNWLATDTVTDYVPGGSPVTRVVTTSFRIEATGSSTIELVGFQSCFSSVSASVSSSSFVLNGSSLTCFELSNFVGRILPGYRTVRYSFGTPNGSFPDDDYVHGTAEKQP